MVTRVASARTTGRTEAGNVMSLRCLEWLISRPLTSTSIASGIWSAGHTTSSAVGDDIDRAAALHAGRLLDIDDVDRNAHPDGGALPQPHEIDVNRVFLDRVELEIARDHAMLGSVDLEIVEGGQKAAGKNALLEFGGIDRNRDGGLCSCRR